MPSVSLFGQAPRVTNIVLRQQFTGDGSATTFQLTSSVGNCTFNTGSWSASRIQTAYPAHATGTDKKPTYDSAVFIVRNRIGVSSIDSSGLVTLDHAPRLGVNFYVWYWYQLQAHDEVDTYREDFVASMEAEAAAYGDQIALDVTNFDGILSATDTTVQQALETIDDYAGGGGYVIYVEEGDVARADSSAADLYIDFDDGDFDVGVVGNECNITINDGGHVHDGATLQCDGVNSDGGAFSFTTSGKVTFSQSVDLDTLGTDEYQIGGNRAIAMPIVNSNIAIGYNAGQDLAAGANYTVLIGYEAGKDITTAQKNTIIGYEAFELATTAYGNVAIGFRAMQNCPAAQATAFENVAIGSSALAGACTGDSNMAIGSQALFTNTSGSNNVAVGADALKLNTSGNSNIALGESALDACTIGNFNMAIGTNALGALTEGLSNVAIGSSSGQNITTGSYSIAIGLNSLPSNQTSDNIIAIGNESGYTITGGGNIAIGYRSSYYTGAGTSNIAIGMSALYGVNGQVSGSCVAVGHQAGRYSYGTYNTFVGSIAGYSSTSSYDTAIGYYAAALTTTGQKYVAIGAYALRYNVTGSYNVAIGEEALEGVTGNSHTGNVAIGYQAGTAVTTGGNNVLVGYQAGDVITTGASNIIIGYDVDPPAAASNSCLNIGGTIFGDLANDKVAIGAVPLTNQCDVGLLNSGVLALKETTTPTADADHGKVYTKNDNKLYFQDGAGNEHEIAFV